MGQPRQQPELQEPPQDEDGVTEYIVAILIGARAVPNPPLSIATALAGLLPTSLSLALRADIAASVATLVLRDLPVPAKAVQGNTAASRDNLTYRALYAIAAQKRIAAAMAKDTGGSDEEKLSRALETEESYFKAHLGASERREKGEALNLAAAEIHGPILGWVHTGTSETHRPSHVKASGKNYRVESPPRATMRALPGTEPGCDCVPGPPFPNTEVMQ